MLEAALFPRKLASHFYFRLLCILFYVGSESKSGSSSAKAKNCGSCGSGSTRLGGMSENEGICHKCAYTRIHNDCVNQNSSAKTVRYTVPLVEKKLDKNSWPLVLQEAL
jgi:hypothetical protein